MLRKSLLAALGFVVMAAMSSSKAQAAVVVGVVVGPVVVAHPSVVVDPRPYVYYVPRRSYAYAPVYARILVPAITQAGAGTPASAPIVAKWDRRCWRR